MTASLLPTCFQSTPSNAYHQKYISLKSFKNEIIFAAIIQLGFYLRCKIKYRVNFTKKRIIEKRKKRDE